MPAKIVQLSSVHPASDTRILHKECRSLAMAGFDVCLIANADSDFELFGVRVRALPKLGGSRIGRMIRQPLNVLRMAREERGDLYHFHDPELMFVGAILRLMGKPVIFDVHESVSKQILSKSWIPGPIRGLCSKAYRIVERTLANVFSAIVIAEPSIQQFFPPAKTTVIHNYPRLEEVAVPDVLPLSLRENIVFYVGGVTAPRGAVEMVEAVNIVAKTMDVHFILGGPISSPSFSDKLHSIAGSETKMVGHMSRPQVVEALGVAKVGLVVLHPIPNYVESFPVKLFEYMAAGIPVITSDFPYWRQFVTDIGAGLMVPPGDPKVLAGAIEQVLADPVRATEMGESGSRAVREHWNWDTEAEKLVQLVTRLTSGE